MQCNLTHSLSLKPVLNLNTYYASLYYIILSCIYDLILSYSTYIMYDIFKSFIKHSCLTWKIRNYWNEIIICNKKLMIKKLFSKSIDFQLILISNIHNLWWFLFWFSESLFCSDFDFQNYQVRWVILPISGTAVVLCQQNVNSPILSTKSVIGITNLPHSEVIPTLKV